MLAQGGKTPNTSTPKKSAIPKQVTCLMQAKVVEKRERVHQGNYRAAIKANSQKYRQEREKRRNKLKINKNQIGLRKKILSRSDSDMEEQQRVVQMKDRLYSSPMTIFFFNSMAGDVPFRKCGQIHQKVLLL